MTTSHRFQSQGTLRFQPNDQRNRTTGLLLVDPVDTTQLMAVSNRRWVRLVTRMLASSLDRQLARGRPQETAFLATRAQVLASTAMRLELAENLAHVLVQARRAPVMRDPRAPLNRDCIVACGPALHRTVQALRAPRPVSARGVAMVSQLLSDGTGPLHNHRRADDLATTLDKAIAELSMSTFP